MQSALTRRSFLKASATASGMGLGVAPALRAFAQDEQPRGIEDGAWKPTTCQGCTSWCAAQVYVENGRAIKVRGNPHSKVNGVNSCVRSHLSPRTRRSTNAEPRNSHP
jgi:anaerobic selenocysteine-containing dehydrogenase